MGELKFKVGDKVMAFHEGVWRDAVVREVDGSNVPYCCRVPPCYDGVWFHAKHVKARPSKRSNGTVTERLRRQVTEQAQEIDRLKALVESADETNRRQAERVDMAFTELRESEKALADMKSALAESEAQKSAIAKAAIGVERDARKNVELEAATCAKLRDLLADAQRGEKRARRTVELMRCVLNMVGEE